MEVVSEIVPSSDMLDITGFAFIQRKGLFREGLFKCTGFANADVTAGEVMESGQCGCLDLDLEEVRGGEGGGDTVYVLHFLQFTVTVFFFNSWRRWDFTTERHQGDQRNSCCRICHGSKVVFSTTAAELHRYTYPAQSGRCSELQFYFYPSVRRRVQTKTKNVVEGGMFWGGGELIMV